MIGLSVCVCVHLMTFELINNFNVSTISSQLFCYLAYSPLVEHAIQLTGTGAFITDVGHTEVWFSKCVNRALIRC